MFAPGTRRHTFVGPVGDRHCDHCGDHFPGRLSCPVGELIEPNPPLLPPPPPHTGLSQQHKFVRCSEEGQLYCVRCAAVPGTAQAIDSCGSGDCPATRTLAHKFVADRFGVRCSLCGSEANEMETNPCPFAAPGMSEDEKKQLLLSAVGTFQLLNAIEKDDLEAVMICVESGNADINFLMVYDEKEQTPLMMVARKGRLAIAQYLAARGVELNKTSTAGFTAIFIAAQEGKLKVLRFLSEQGADKDKASNDGVTPLCIAARNGHLDVVQSLVVELGVDVNKATIEAGGRYTPLHIAVLRGHIDVAVCLMERGMADLNARNTDGQRPVDLATNEEMRQAIINEEKRRRDHGFKRAVIPNSISITGQGSNENGGQGQVNASAMTAEEEGGDNDDNNDEDSDGSDEENED